MIYVDTTFRISFLKDVLTESGSKFIEKFCSGAETLDDEWRDTSLFFFWGGRILGVPFPELAPPPSS